MSILLFLLQLTPFYFFSDSHKKMVKKIHFGIISFNFLSTGFVANGTHINLKWIGVDAIETIFYGKDSNLNISNSNFALKIRIIIKNNTPLSI